MEQVRVIESNVEVLQPFDTCCDEEPVKLVEIDRGFFSTEKVYCCPQCMKILL